MDEKLPIIEVTGDNFAQVWPSISRAVKDATFVAMDCVSSGGLWQGMKGDLSRMLLHKVIQKTTDLTIRSL